MSLSRSQKRCQGCRANMAIACAVATGGVNAWMMFGALANGSDVAFSTPTATRPLTDAGWIKGFSTLADIYKSGLAPKDSVNWGYNDIIAGFYSGTCAMIDNDPDAMIAIAERMKPDEYGVAPWIKGPSGKSFPTIGYSGWSMFANQQAQLELTWKTDRHPRRRPGQPGLEPPHRRAAHLYRGGERSAIPLRPQSSRAGSMSSTISRDVVPMVMPVDLRAWAPFASSIVPRTSPESAALATDYGAGDGAAMVTGHDQSETEPEVSVAVGRRSCSRRGTISLDGRARTDPDRCGHAGAVEWLGSLCLS